MRYTPAMETRAPTWNLAVLVCCNVRRPEHPRSSCGAGGDDLVGFLRDRARDIGRKKQLVVHRTGCLNACGGGTSIALLSPDERTILKVDTSDREAVWSAVCDALDRTVTR